MKTVVKREKKNKGKRSQRTTVTFSGVTSKTKKHTRMTHNSEDKIHENMREKVIKKTN